uniref:Uncharacterized protein n=1 Tax=Nelumbo nucifera TaxID=4432 RepID=A0A822ZL46_NELNU|nr:TPA_asm: hypothetical protein HUJ06_004132 [Nelumbo nucifera]
MEELVSTWEDSQTLFLPGQHYLMLKEAEVLWTDQYEDSQTLFLHY